MPIIRRQLKPSDVYPEDIRYDPETDTIQSLVNGEWIDNPDADPRHQTTLPPRITADPACDAAQSVVDAFKGQIDGILIAIDNGGTAFTIAGSILSLFTFGPFGVLITVALGIANAMLDAGTTALSDALTSEVYHDMVCILSCHMNTSGRTTEGGLTAAQGEITDQVGGLGAAILNSMLALSGEGGVNNLASLGTSTGDCSDCECRWCYSFDFELSDGGFSLVPSTGGVYVSGEGWRSDYWLGGDANGYRTVDIKLDFSANITSVELSVDMDVQGTPPYSPNWVYVATNVGAIITSGGTPVTPGNYVFTWDGSQTVTGFAVIQVSAGFGSGGFDPGGQVTLKSVLLRGTGDNPFGMDNCS